MNKFEIENLNLHYGDFHALKNIQMDIAENEITAFIGPSGCGKSTFLKCLNRMNDLVEGCKITGKIELDGEDIYGNMDVNQLRKRVPESSDSYASGRPCQPFQNDTSETKRNSVRSLRSSQGSEAS